MEEERARGDGRSDDGRSDIAAEEEDAAEEGKVGAVCAGVLVEVQVEHIGLTPRVLKALLVSTTR